MRRAEEVITGQSAMSPLSTETTILQHGHASGIEDFRRSLRGEIPRVRSEIAQRLVKELGMSLAEVARLTGVSTSAISKIIKRRADEETQ